MACMSAAEIRTRCIRLEISADLVRHRERSSENYGTSGTLDAELERWNGCLKPDGILSDGSRGFRFPASPQLVVGLRILKFEC